MPDGTTTLHEPSLRAVGRVPERRFFLGMAIVLLGLIFVGFAPTFFLKPLFGTPELPIYLHIHAVVFTSWFVLFLVQASLIAKGNVALHRRIGMASGFLAGAIIISGLSVLYFRTMAFHDGHSDLMRTTQLVWGNLSGLAAFGTFMGLGIWFRRRREVHKRFMLLASLSMIGPALARLATFEPFQVSDARVVNDVVYGLGGLAALLGAAVLYDVLRRGRPHPVVLWGGVLLIGSIVFTGLILSRSGFAQGLILLFG